LGFGLWAAPNLRALGLTFLAPQPLDAVYQRLELRDQLLTELVENREATLGQHFELERQKDKVRHLGRGRASDVEEI
jgi:hypothetical protein